MTLENKSKQELVDEIDKLKIRLLKYEAVEKNFPCPITSQEIINHLPEGIAITDQNSKFIYTNPAFDKIFGYEAGELVGQLAHILNAPTDVDPIEMNNEITKQMNEQGFWSGELQSLKKDGSLVWTNAKLAILTQENGDHIFIGTQENISDKKQTEAKLIESASRLSALVNANPDIMFVFDKEGNYLEYYAKEVELYADSSTLIGSNIAEVMPVEIADVVFRNIKSLLNGESELESFDYEVEVNGVVGSFSARMVKSEGDQVLAVVTDVTENKLLRKQMLQSQKLEAIGILSGGVAHEFNNLLGPIIGHAELVAKNIDGDASSIESLNQIIQAGERAKLLIKKLLAYGRKSQSKKVAVDLSNVVGDVLSFIAKTLPKNIEITSELKEGLVINAMSEEIQQVVLNLILNSVQSMPKGGALTIKTELEIKDVDFPDVLREGVEYCCLTVIDTGCGIDNHTLERMFDPFFTNRGADDSSGLGLSVVHGIVQQHDGFIEVDSSLGRGTSFHVCIPQCFDHVNLEEKVELATHVAVGKVATNFGFGKVLVIDDEPLMVGLIEKMLSSLNFEVESFSDELEALNLFSKFSEQFELVITDYGMPSMNGFRIAERIQEIRPSIPILIVSGYSDAFSNQEYLMNTSVRYLPKPFTLGQLSEMIVALTKPAEYQKNKLS